MKEKIVNIKKEIDPNKAVADFLELDCNRRILHYSWEYIT